MKRPDYQPLCPLFFFYIVRFRTEALVAERFAVLAGYTTFRRRLIPPIGRCSASACHGLKDIDSHFTARSPDLSTCCVGMRRVATISGTENSSSHKTEGSSTGILTASLQLYFEVEDGFLGLQVAGQDPSEIVVRQILRVVGWMSAPGLARNC